VASCSYSPSGMRGQGPIRAIKYGLDDEQAYIRGAKDEVWKVLQVENMEGYRNLDAILSVPGADSLFVGPADSRVAGGSPFLKETDLTQDLLATSQERGGRRWQRWPSLGSLGRTHHIRAHWCKFSPADSRVHCRVEVPHLFKGGTFSHRRDTGASTSVIPHSLAFAHPRDIR